MGRGEEVPPTAGQDVARMGASEAGPEPWAPICPGTPGRMPARPTDITARAGPIFATLVLALTVPSLIPPGTPADEGPGNDVGTVDFSFQANGVKAPTGRKPEAAKLWVNDGSWWGVLFVPARDAYMIERFDWPTGAWVDTGVMVDDR